MNEAASAFVASCLPLGFLIAIFAPWFAGSIDAGVKEELMSDHYSQARPGSPAARADMAIDAGLRSFMLGVYNKMGLGLLLSGVLAYVVGTNLQLAQILLAPPIGYLVMFGPLAILLISGFVMKNPSPTAAALIYWSVVSLFGVSLGGIVLAYAGIPSGMVIVAKAFLITSLSFGSLSLWGYTTKRDLTGWGSFLMMGLFGIIIASLVNWGFRAFTGAEITGLSFAISIIGVLVFAGLTAYDTQRLKFMYYDLAGNARGLAVATTYGALSLYLDFINLFLFILRLLSPRN